MKPGYKTTELIVTVLADVGMLAAALAGHLSPHWAALAVTVSTSAYAISRGLAKLYAVPVAPPPVPPPTVPSR